MTYLVSVTLSSASETEDGVGDSDASSPSPVMPPKTKKNGTPAPAEKKTPKSSKSAKAKSDKKKPPEPEVVWGDDDDELASNMVKLDLDEDFDFTIKDPWKRCAFIYSDVDEQYYVCRVDIFLLALVEPKHVLLQLSKCGMYLEYERKIPGWIGNHKHFQLEFLANNPGVVWEPSNTENMALFETAQKIRKAYPRMDEEDKVLDTNVQLIPLKFKCKGNPFGINLTYYPVPLTVQYGNVRHHGFHFKLSCKFKGEKEILKVKAQAAAQACSVPNMDSLYD